MVDGTGFGAPPWARHRATAGAGAPSAASADGQAAGSGSSDPAAGPGRLLRDLLTQAAQPPLVLALAALNHVIRQQRWARQRLRSFAGRSVRLALDADGGPARWLPPLTATIDDDGTLRAQPSFRRVTPAVTLWLRPSFALLGALSSPDRESRIPAHLRIEGDVLLAAALAELAAQLRWDVEDDLSRMVGDVAAHRLSRAASDARREAARMASRARTGTLHYVTSEQPMLVARAQVQHRAAELDDLGARVAALHQRVDALAASGPRQDG